MSSELSKLREIEQENRELKNKLQYVTSMGKIGNLEIDLKNDKWLVDHITIEILQTPLDFSFNLNSFIGLSPISGKDRVKNYFNSLTKNKGTSSIVLPVSTKKGVMNKWVKLTGRVTDRNKEDLIYEGIIQDISAEIQNKPKNQDQYEKLRIIFEISSNYGYCLETNKDGEYHLKWLFGGIDETLGYSEEEISSFSRIGLTVHSDDKQVFKRRKKELLKGNINISEYRVKHKDGHYVWIRDKAVPKWDVSRKRVSLVYGYVIDISSEKKTEIANKNLALASANTHNGVVVTDKDTRVTWVNEGFTKITGYSLEEITEKKLGVILQGEKTNPADVEAIKSGIKSKEPFSCEVLNYNKNGEPYWNELSITPLKDENGEVEKFVGIQANVTKRKEIQLSLDQKNLELINALERKDVLFKELHHRIKHNLQLISSIIFLKSGSISNSNEKIIIDDVNLKISQIAAMHNHLLGLEEINKLHTKQYLKEQIRKIMNANFKAAHTIDTNIDIDDFQLSIDKILSISLIINELIVFTVNNDERNKALTVNLKKQKDSLVLSYEDTALSEINYNKKMEKELIEALSTELNGKMKMTNNGSFKYNLVFPQ